MTKPAVLYVTYDGILEPLGESQVIAYLERLADDFSITLLSYEKPQDFGKTARVDDMRARLGRRGITWLPLRYHRRPPVLSTIVDVCYGLGCVLPRARGGRFAIVHARSYVPSLIALGVKALTGSKFIFDMRGFWVDERADTGQWPRGTLMYRVGKWFERKFFESADGIVSLTQKAVDAFPSLGYDIAATTDVTVIPTCVDLERFQPRAPRQNATTGNVIGCVGTLSNWYLREQTLSYLAWLSQHVEGLRFLFITREDHARLEADAKRAGLPADRLTITEADFKDMPDKIRAIDIGVFFIQPCFSKLASAATKLGEFMGSGIPVVINDGIGDSGEFVRRHRVGVVLLEATPAHFEATLGDVRALLTDGDAARRCREAAEYFRLERGVDAYRRLYDALTGRAASRVAGDSWNSMSA